MGRSNDVDAWFAKIIPVLAISTIGCAASPHAPTPTNNREASGVSVGHAGGGGGCLGDGCSAVSTGNPAATAGQSCRPLAAEPLGPLSPHPGFWRYAAEGLEPPALRTGDVVYAPSHLVSTPDGPEAFCVAARPGYPGMLVPFDARPARVLRGDGIELRRYMASGGEQTSLVVALAHDAACPPGLYALDAKTLEMRWRLASALDRTPEAPDAVPWVLGLESSGLLALRFQDLETWRTEPHAPGELVVLEAATGSGRWRQPIPATTFPGALGGSVVVTAADGTVTALARDSGATLFELKAPDRPLAVDTSVGHLALVLQRSRASSLGRPLPCHDERCSLDLWIADARDGNLRHRIPLGSAERGVLPGVRIDGGTVYVEAPRELSAFRGARIEAYGAPDGRRLWATPVIPCGSSPTGPGSLQTTRSELVACGCDGVLRTISRSDGRVTAHFGVGRCGAILHSGGAIAFALRAPEFGIGVIDPAALPAPERVTLTGVVRADADLRLRFPRWVRVGPELTKTDALGRFRLVLEGRGVYSVELEITAADPPLVVDELSIALDPGKTAYAAELRVHAAAH